MIVANLATAAIGADDNEVTILDAISEHKIPKADKAGVARVIVDHATELYLKERQNNSSSLKSVKNA